MNKEHFWNIWVDTGGTFTDCIALDPQGVKRRIKILSSSTLRGRLIRKINPFVYEFEAAWNFDSKLLENYYFEIPSLRLTSRLLHINYQHNTLTIEDNLVTASNIDFQLTTKEEAPILATRLVTATPLNRPLPPIKMRLGTTKATNALLEQKGAKTTLFVTKGFKDLLAINGQKRPHLFQHNIPAPTILYNQIIEVEERLEANGNVLTPLPDELPLVHDQQESIAISLLHATTNPIHEQALAKKLAEDKAFYLTLSSEIAPFAHYLKRTQTTVVNAYLKPILNEYLKRITERLSTESEVLILSSTGTLHQPDHYEAKDSLLSGPAGGVAAATAIGKQFNRTQLLTFDMGGTSTDTTRIDGYPTMAYTTKIDQIELHNPTLSIETVAAGGGSICWFDGHTLQVGPDSAGAFPGPACYGAGGPLTLTDVNLLLGKLDASQMSIPIHLDASVQAMETLLAQIQETTGKALRADELLKGFEEIANEKMANAIRKVSLAKGFNPSDYTLLAFGGAGGLHACQLADLLKISEVILPYDAGLFSANGMQYAKVASLQSKQILRLYKDVQCDLPAIVETLEQHAVQELEQQNIKYYEQRFCVLLLRIKGQQHTVEVEYSSADIIEEFHHKFAQQFGYSVPNADIEVESVRLLWEEQQKIPSTHTIVKGTRMASTAKHLSPLVQSEATSTIPVYYWEHLHEAETIAGPAILLSTTSSSYIPINWRASIQTTKDIVCYKEDVSNTSTSSADIETIALQLFYNRFAAIADEMGVQLQRTALSLNVKERLDFSCAILDPHSQLLVNAQHIPVHLGSMGICGRLILDALPLAPGDVIITNHPQYGGSHLPDVTLLSGAYTPEGELIGYVINRAHHAEIGGKTPGSMPPDAINLVEEGVVIPPHYLAKNGVIDLAQLEYLFTSAPYPTRDYAMNKADILAAYSSLQKGISQLQALVSQHGLATVHKYMQLIHENAHQQLVQALTPYFGKTYKAVEYLDDGSRIALTITIQEDQQVIDFTGSSKRHPFNLNANISIIYSAVLYVLRLLVDKDIPLNDGLMKDVKLILPEDSFLHPQFSAVATENPAVVGGNTEVSQRLTDTLLKAFGQVACSQGTMNNFLFGNDHFGYYETIGGGTGAGANFNGRSAVHQHMTNTQITDPEDLERNYPIRVRAFSIRENSGGKGRYHGGDGIIRHFEFLEPLTITLLGQHRYFAPYGMAGGGAGKTGEHTLIRHTGTVHKLPSVYQTQVSAHDQLIIETPGGGGYGESDGDY